MYFSKHQNELDFCLEISFNQDEEKSRQNIKKLASVREKKIIALEKSKDNKTLIKTAFNKIKSIEKREDTFNMYCFTNLKNSNYKDFIEIINQIKIYKLRYKELVDDTIFIYYSKPQKVEGYQNFQPHFCGTSEQMNRELFRKQKAVKKASALKKFQEKTAIYKFLIPLTLGGIFFCWTMLPLLGKNHPPTK